MNSLRHCECDHCSQVRFRTDPTGVQFALTIAAVAASWTAAGICNVVEATRVAAVPSYVSVVVLTWYAGYKSAAVFTLLWQGAVLVDSVVLAGLSEIADQRFFLVHAAVLVIAIQSAKYVQRRNAIRRLEHLLARHASATTFGAVTSIVFAAPPNSSVQVRLCMAENELRVSMQYQDSQRPSTRRGSTIRKIVKPSGGLICKTDAAPIEEFVFDLSAGLARDAA